MSDNTEYDKPLIPSSQEYEGTNKSAPPPNKPPRSLLDAQVSWGGQAGECFECWLVEPCCGSPCNLEQGLYCFCCFLWCAPCVSAKILAYSVDQDCQLVNHCLIPWAFVAIPNILFIICASTCCSYCSIFQYLAPAALSTLLRHNLREKYNVYTSSEAEGWLGDFLFSYFCSCCSWLQQIRSMPIDGWDWWSHRNRIDVSAPFRYIRPRQMDTTPYPSYDEKL
eukprot:NODE_6591_length_867_cov_36.272849_g5995_i0.p1 GENE.NODE_6591_length_867_cov_36.272849_g5995_i0~~NODE_6591_length_867_cov_36.272849_g5995_i0.p1  ORF type:complete len:241 (+),score=33.03 NODE_6591_length_867_cov_36.272849_g5995_i0:56-724(+)